MDRDKAKQLVRNAPTIEATFATLDAELKTKRAEVNALQARHDELSAQLTAVAVARLEFESTGEPVPDSQPATKPKQKGTK